MSMKWNWKQPTHKEVEQQIKKSGSASLTKENRFPKIPFRSEPERSASRLEVEETAAHDLVKPYEQLLADIHEELTKPGEVAANLLDAQKRIASLMVRTAQSAERLTQKLICLTWVLAGLTAVLLAAALAQLLQDRTKSVLNDAPKISRPVPSLPSAHKQ